ncbi:MarR family winged helix-turn-helix transcriptional regulator [Paracoccus sp. (in: a-proteobacteria)]|uniref:MarR family winged helix-turn-helix transcriptional regulator n=1 Tax=Paracoccus sp. TaxID=267 RepID=UPI00396C413E
MPDTAIIDSLLQVMRTLRRHYDDCARDMGLTMARAQVITTLSREEGLTQTELAARLGIETPTLKRQLDGLEADGFLERRSIPGDARKNALFLTERGRDSQITRFSRKLRSDVLEGIDPEALSQARRVLDQIAANIARLDRK